VGSTGFEVKVEVRSSERAPWTLNETAHSRQELNLPFVCSDNFSGGYIGGVTPVPIPNTEVKPSRADGTPRETARESRSPPGFFE
jgi:hypothetical protein